MGIERLGSLGKSALKKEPKNKQLKNLFTIMEPLDK
jgi:hypothetical protein